MARPRKSLRDKIDRVIEDLRQEQDLIMRAIRSLESFCVGQRELGPPKEPVWLRRIRREGAARKAEKN